MEKIDHGQAYVRKGNHWESTSSLGGWNYKSVKFDKEHKIEEEKEQAGKVPDMRIITAQSPTEQVQTLSLIMVSEDWKSSVSIEGEICINQDRGPGGS